MNKAKIGLVCLVRTTFDYKTAFELYTERMAEVKKDDSVDWCDFGEMVISPEDAVRASDFLQDCGVDAVVLVSATFHLGHLALIIRDRVRKPLLLWGFDELPYNGGKIRLNAVCGVNLNASNLYKAGCDDYIVHVGNTIDEDFVKAVKIIHAIEKCRIGLIGYRADGFFNVGVDELHLYRETGTLVTHYELSDLFGGEASEEDVLREKEHLLKTFDVSRLTGEQVEKVARLCVLATGFVRRENTDAIAIRCWPEFAKNYGVSPCAMMSVLQSRGILLACEGDVEAALSMIAVRAAGEKTPFMADLS